MLASLTVHIIGIVKAPLISETTMPQITMWAFTYKLLTHATLRASHTCSRISDLFIRDFKHHHTLPILSKIY
jgi:hypothetical protein